MTSSAVPAEPVPPSGPGEQAVALDVLLVAVAALVPFAGMLLSAGGLDDGDTGWHLALGHWIMEHGAVPHADPFSFTAPGRPWTAHEWLAGLSMAVAYDLAGWSGVLLLYAVPLAAMFGAIALYLRRWLPPAPAAGVLVLLLAGLMPFMLARPHVLAWPLLAVWLIALLRAREEGRAPPLAVALLMTLWANIHGSFALGLALVGPFAAEAVLAERRGDWPKQVWLWGRFAVAALLASLVTPYGLHGLLFPLQLVGMPMLAMIDEWQPTRFDRVGLFEVVLLAGLFACLLRPVRVPWLRLLVIVGLLHLALAHLRHQAIFVLVAGLLLAAPLAPSWGRNGGEPRFDLRDGWRAHLAKIRPLVAMAVVAAVALAVWRVAVPFQRPDSGNVPASAVAALPPDLRGEPVFNDYSFGGSLIGAGYRVFIDGRVDMYGPEIFDEYLRASSGDAASWRETVHRHKIRWAMLAPDSPLADLLEREPGWRRIYADQWAEVFVDEALRLPAPGSGTRENAAP